MITLIRKEKMTFKHDGKIVDFDRYEIEVKTQISTKEYAIIVDFINHEITGDCVAYGSWFDIDENECKELLHIILKDNKPIRNFSKFI